ncbi:hypothetical protein QFZ80_007546 [Paenibacillus sp. V4I7]|nr:hypothetical protein [Paenibacillus sp. V4I7]MDQ0917808.1 hypothetical protein [Paenibacillus sp. V4I5]
MKDPIHRNQRTKKGRRKIPTTFRIDPLRVKVGVFS